MLLCRKVTKPLTTEDFLYVPQMTFVEEIIPSLLLVFGLPGNSDDDGDDDDYDVDE